MLRIRSNSLMKLNFIARFNFVVLPWVSLEPKLYIENIDDGKYNINNPPFKNNSPDKPPLDR